MSLKGLLGFLSHSKEPDYMFSPLLFPLCLLNYAFIPHYLGYRCL